MKIYNDGYGEVRLLHTMGEDETPAQAARVSFSHLTHGDGMTERDEKLIRYLAAHHHTSPFEHISATFELTVPIFVARQIMRHRTFSFNELSRRYTSKALKIYHPMEIKRQAVTNLQCSTDEEPEELDLIQAMMLSSAEQDLALYAELISKGVARETARMVLPCSTYTTFWMTGNIHNWVKFIRLRDTDHVQLETRLATQAIKAKLIRRFPVSTSSLLSDEYS